MTNRIPTLTGNTLADMDQWFADMANAGLIFHPDDNAVSIVTDDGQPLFSPDEAAQAQAVIDGFHDRFGTLTHDTAYPHFMRAAHHPLG